MILPFTGLIVQFESGPLVHGRNREGTLVVVLTIGRFDQVDSESGISTPRIEKIRITLTVGRFDYRTKDEFLVYRE